MKKPTKQELDLLDVISTIQSRLIALDKKVDALLERSASKTQPKPTPPVTQPQQSRQMYTAICADCQKECSIPFKPNSNRPIYCQDCFSRRKVISLSRIGLDDKPKETALVTITPPAPTKKPAAKKKAVAVKKVIVKKKAMVKKK